jgi:uncharacterized repeat protein (TIGR03806 family)
LIIATGFVVCLPGSPGPAFAGDGAWKSRSPSTEFECRWAAGLIKIDGKADEEAWKHAKVIDHFFLPWLGMRARTATRARLLWDREYLYFHAEMEDRDLQGDVKEPLTWNWQKDAFGLFLQPAADKPGYYEFQVDPVGRVASRFIPQRTKTTPGPYRKDADLHIEAKVVLHGTLNRPQDRDQGWSVEGRIPWRDLLRTGGRPEVNERWRFALCRCDSSADARPPEWSTCAPLKTQPVGGFHQFEDYATLRFVKADTHPTRPFGIARRIRLTTSRVVGWPDPPPPFRTRRVYPELKLSYPIAVTHQPGSDRLLAITQAAAYGATHIIRFKDDPRARDTEVLLKLDGVAYDIKFHPQFPKNGYVYVGWNGPSSGASADRKTRVTHYTMNSRSPYRLDPSSALEIIAWPSDGHNGGAMAFGHDGKFYVTSGDGTSDSDTNVVGQDLTRLTSKVLRIDVEHPDRGRGAYSVPPDNPFVGVKGVRPETWAYGLRNPWRMTVDQKTGHIWVGQNGQDLWEQAYLVRKGENYGWSVTEGSHPFYPNRRRGPTPITKPTLEHPHSEFRSLTGGIVYYGKKFPELRGVYIYGDYSTGKVWGARHDGKRVTWHKELARTRLQITGFGTDSQGEILITDHRAQDQGGIYTLERTPPRDRGVSFPRNLSDSGLFQSVKGHVMQPALIPYSVNAPLWSDGAYKERYLALPGGDSHFDLTTSRGWNLPEKTVLVKSFALEMEDGNPASRRWIETRFLTNQDGEWFGYSYAWNDAQTEGTLVDTAGIDRQFTIRVKRSRDNPTGVRQQTWHYPSRTECMVCHSRAANFVLGMTELQMNKVHDYGRVADSQLRTLEHLGVLRVNWAEETRSAMREEAQARGLTEVQINALLAKQTASGIQRQPAISSMLTFAPEKYPKLVDPYDAHQDANLRARSYLHANCAQCHVEAGGGNAQMELEFTTPLDRARIVDVKPLHNTFNLQGARLVAPGHPERSVLLHRIRHRQAGFMPPLATSVVDRQAVELIEQWIKQLKPNGSRKPKSR